MGFFQQIFNDTHRPTPEAPVFPDVPMSFADTFSHAGTPEGVAPAANMITAAPQASVDKVPLPLPQTLSEGAPATARPRNLQPEMIASTNDTASDLYSDQKEPADSGPPRLKSHRLDASTPPPESAQKPQTSPQSERHDSLRKSTAGRASKRPNASLQPPIRPPSAQKSVAADAPPNSSATAAPAPSSTPQSTGPSPSSVPPQDPARPLSADASQPPASIPRVRTDSNPPPQAQTPSKAAPRSIPPLPPVDRSHTQRRPLHETARLPRPPTPPAPTVRIGHIDIVIQAPPAPAKAEPVATPSSSGAWFLRSL